MTRRPRRIPTPSFKMPPPYNALTGMRDSLQSPTLSPHCALFQVAADDDKANYVICRGWDTRTNSFVEYDGSEGKPGIPVAKPYGARQTGIYAVGQVHVAMLPVCELGHNPGVAETTEGHPADLDEEIELLYTDEDNEEDRVVIEWMMLTDGTAVATLKSFCTFTLGEELEDTDQTASATIEEQWGYGADHESTSITVYNMEKSGGDYEFYGDSGDYGRATYSGSGTTWYIENMECP